MKFQCESSQGHKGLICLKIDTINLEMYFPHLNMMNFAVKRLGENGIFSVLPTCL